MNNIKFEYDKNGVKDVHPEIEVLIMELIYACLLSWCAFQ